MSAQLEHPQIYDGEGDPLMQKEQQDLYERITLVPDALPSKTPDTRPHLRIMWGQHLLEDLLLGRYRSLICAANGEDNSRGIIAQLAQLLPTSQWDEKLITQHAHQISSASARVKVIKYDMDMVEVLAILRPPTRKHLTVEDLATAFKIVAEMIHRKSARLPSASVSFLGARANVLVGPDGREPSFETVLRTMYEAGYTGDVYPSPAMWHLDRLAVFPRYPFPESLDRMRAGGY